MDLPRDLHTHRLTYVSRFTTPSGSMSPTLYEQVLLRPTRIETYWSCSEAGPKLFCPYRRFISTSVSVFEGYFQLCPLLLFFLCRVLCETVKDFVSKVGTASANSDPSQADEPDSLAQKVCIYLYSLVVLLFLNSKLNISTSLACRHHHHGKSSISSTKMTLDTLWCLHNELIP